MCQSILYQLLYENVLKMEDAMEGILFVCLLLEPIEYQNNSTESRCMFVLKLPRFFTRPYGEGKSTVISIFAYICTSSFYIVLALGFQHFFTASCARRS